MSRIPRERQLTSSLQRESGSPIGNSSSISYLRRRCQEEGLPVGGRKATLISRLQQHTARNSNAATLLAASAAVAPSPGPDSQVTEPVFIIIIIYLIDIPKWVFQ